MEHVKGAVRVRADEVRPGDQLVVDGENLGTLKQVGTAGTIAYLHGEHRSFVRNMGELVWVVRPEPTVTLTITLPERTVREYARCELSREVAEESLRAAVEWVAANPQDGDR